MWQISWMLGLLPSWFWTLVLILGIVAILASWVLKFIPFISTYRLPIQVGGIIAMLVGVFYQGFYSNEEKWQAKVREMEAKIAEAQAQATAASRAIEVKVVEKTKVIKERGQTQIQYIDRVVKGDTQVITKDMSEAERAEFKKKQEELEQALKMCPVPRLIVEEHNKAAMPPEIIKEINKAASGDKK